MVTLFYYHYYFFHFIPIKLLGHLLWVAKKVAEQENLKDSGYRIGKRTQFLNCIVAHLEPLLCYMYL